MASNITPKRLQWAGPTDWEEKRGVITRLYSSENRPLKEVMEIMEREYGFHATMKMYKHRFKRWGVVKYVNALNARKIARLERDDDLHHSSRGALVIRPQATDIATPMASTARPKSTHPPAGNGAELLPQLYTRVSSPFIRDESAFHSVKLYYDVSFGSSSTWTQVSPSSGVVEVKPNLPQIRDQLQDLHTRFRIALNKLTVKPTNPAELVEGIKIMRVAFARLPLVLASEDPILINHILDLVRRLQDSGQTYLESQLRRHIAALAQAPGQPHSTTIISRILSSGFPLDRDHRVLLTQIVVEEFRQHLGPWHFETLQLEMWYLFNREQDWQSRAYVLRRLYAKVEAGVGKDVFDDRHLDILMNLSSALLRAEEPEQVLEVTGQVFSDSDRRSELDKHPDHAYNFYWLSAKALGKQDKHLEAESYVRMAMGIAKKRVQEDNDDDVTYLSAMEALVTNLRNQGRLSDADEVHNEMQTWIRNSLEKVGEKEDAT
ncbi:hypothetical protein JX266_011381 [Neoarthrinium moseri]|nr:hypothetical protein JX266_011381 [Neoarthrinium moseri]